MSVAGVTCPVYFGLRNPKLAIARKMLISPSTVIKKNFKLIPT